MNRIIKHFQKKLKSNIPEFRRYLYHEIDWSQRLILILGHRGSGENYALITKGDGTTSRIPSILV